MLKLDRIFLLALSFLFFSLPESASAETRTVLESGGYHTCTYWSDILQCWGSNRSGELGAGFVNDQSSAPLRVQGIPPATEARVTRLALGAQHSCAVTDSGHAYCWGSNTYGQLGIGSIAQANSAQPILFKEKIAQISAGAVHTCILSEGGGVFCFGRNNQGQLGNGLLTQSLVPTPVLGLSEKIIQIVSGDFHTCALHENGSVFCWGQNLTGQLGTGNIQSTLVPVQVRNAVGDSILTGVQQLFKAAQHTCALLTDQIQCWGSNASGQIRRTSNSETPNFYSLPIPLSGLILPTLGISGGLLHSCAWNKEGIQCWGDNAYGQSGPSQDPNRATPNTFELDQPPLRVTTGEIHSCALTLTHQIWCWGDHTYGQLGSASFAPGKSFQPIRVEGLKSE